MDSNSHDMILAKRQEQLQLEWEIQEIVDHYLGDGEGQWHKVSIEWECPQSPYGWCTYHKIEDPADDGCIFCHQPRERK